jgi:sialidase-1
MSDLAAQWGLEDFECLYQYARTLDLPEIDGHDGFGIAFWFWAQDHVRTQEIVSSIGAKYPWQICIDDGYLVLHLADPIHDTIRLSLISASWQQAALVFDPVTQQVDLHLGRSSASYALLAPMVAEALRPSRLLVGGRTDPAGGHYDHTFGRGGSGLIDDMYWFAGRRPKLETPATNETALQVGIVAEPDTGQAPIEVHFAAELGDDATYPVHYLWEFGDGLRTTYPNVTHHYDYAGDYRVRLRVVDAQHAQGTANCTVRVIGPENPIQPVPVFINGSEGYACYRIPSIVRALNDDLLAFAEARLESCSDSTQTIHIVCKRSSDSGTTWSPLTLVTTIDGFVCMNASPVVDEVHGTGRVIVVFRAADHSEWDIARGIGLSRALCVTSTDHGMTWDTPWDISSAVHKPYNPGYRDRYPYAALPANQAHDWRIQIPAQGHAIQLRRLPQTRGRLFFIGSLTRGERSIFESENYAFWSDDLGQTWQVGGIIPHIGLNEAIAVELENGSVLINTRAYTDQKPDGRRAITRARFDAEGAIHFEATTHDEALIDPAVQASLLRCTWADQTEYGGQSRILFSNPAHPLARVNLTVRLSYDEGATWAYSKVIDRGPSAYSDLVMTTEHQPAVLYERGNTGGIAFARFSLAWLTDGADAG